MLPSVHWMAHDYDPIANFGLMQLLRLTSYIFFLVKDVSSPPRTKNKPKQVHECELDQAPIFFYGFLF